MHSLYLAVLMFYVQQISQKCNTVAVYCVLRALVMFYHRLLILIILTLQLSFLAKASLC